MKTSLLALALACVAPAVQAADAQQLQKSLKLPASVEKALATEAQSPEASYDVKMWLGAVGEGKYQDAAHTWGAVSTAFRPPVRDAAEATYLFLLWNQDLAQTFADQLIGQLGRKSFVKSAAWQDVQAEIAPRLADYLQANAIIFSQEQRATLAKLPWEGVAVDLKAWSLLRAGDQAQAALAYLPEEHPWRHLLELSTSLGLAKKREPAAAIEILEKQLAAGKIREDLQAAYHLQLGRLYYQKADLVKAEENYLKVPIDSESGAESREELLWVWLRRGETDKLRGTLEALAHPRFKERFAPELFVVRAISNLKLCYYDEVKSDFHSFLTQNNEWAKKVDAALNEATPPTPPNADWYIQMVESAVTKRAAEKERIKTLFQESIASSLPGIGLQKHWLDAQGALAGHGARLEKLKEAEYRRQWRNSSLLLTEAIRKMRFVKIELISQLNMGQTAKPESEVSQANEEAAEDKIEKDAEGKWSFPFDGVMWPDEMFAARSTAHNVCL